MATLSRTLSGNVFAVRTAAELNDWLAAVSKETGGLGQQPLGGISNNVHTVEVAASSALALVERPINSIDAELELESSRRNDAAPQTPHEAAARWFGVPANGLSGMSEKDRRKLASNIRVTMHESGIGGAPSISIQDAGTGVHPDDFPKTVLSLLGDNKKMKRYVMGVYNAGGAASFKFAQAAILVGRLEPSLLKGRRDEIGVSVVRYNPLDPSAYKTGTYEYVTAKDGSIIRLDLPELPNGMPHGFYTMLVEYQMPKYASVAYGPKKSLWQLFHTSLPNAPLPFLIVETRSKLLPKGKKEESRVVNGLLHQLSDDSVAKYREERDLDLGSEIGTVTLRYFVLNATQKDLDYYVKAEQALTLTLNGQRQHAKSRVWLKAETELHYLFKRLIVVVDCTGITGYARRQLFPSTREMAADTEVTRVILDRVVRELKEDTDLYDLDEQARDNALSQSTKSTTEKVRKRLASQITAVLQGTMQGKKGGGQAVPKKPKRTSRKRTKPRPPRDIDDAQYPDIPDKIEILNTPFEIEQGHSKGVRLAINAKNGFIPDKFNDLKFIFVPELRQHLTVGAKGRLLGGVMRVTLEAAENAPIGEYDFSVDMTSEALGVSEKAKGRITVAAAKPPVEEEDDASGGEPDVDIKFVGRASWDQLNFDAESVGVCHIKKNDNGDTIAVEWVLNSDFEPFEAIREAKNITGAAEEALRDRYGYAIAMGLFSQERDREELVKKHDLAQEDDEAEADSPASDVYVKRERARWARAVLIAMEPEVTISLQSQAETDSADIDSDQSALVGVADE